MDTNYHIVFELFANCDHYLFVIHELCFQDDEYLLHDARNTIFDEYGLTFFLVSDLQGISLTDKNQTHLLKNMFL